MSKTTRVSQLAGTVASLCALALSGCRGTPLDVAKGRPTDPESSYVANDYQPKEQEGFWGQLTPDNTWKAGKKLVGLGPDKEKASQHFAEGEKLLTGNQFDQAAKQFGKAVGRWPDSTLEEDAMFLQAESYLFANRLSSANDMYNELLKKYPNSRHLTKTAARQFSIGRYWQEIDRAKHLWALAPNFTDRTRPMFDTWGHATNCYDAVRVNDPRGPLADAAIMAQANMYFQAKRYEDADYYYGLLRHDYPKSKFQVDAHLLGLQSKLRKYQGPGYNGKPLEEAEELIDLMLVQFPTELGDEHERIVKAKAEVRAQKATRDIQLAQYWDNGKHYGAAKIYYAQVLRDYPQTPFAEQAKTRLAAIQGEPDHPPNRLAFITDWFEPSETVKR